MPGRRTLPSLPPAAWLPIVLAAVACNALAPSSAPLSPSPNPSEVHSDAPAEGELGIVFQRGVECLANAARPAEADVVYVSPQGNDRNDGTAPAAAFRTLARALCHVRPGQTVRILPGTYRETVILGEFGGPEAAITIEGVAEGGRLPVLDGESARTLGLGLAGCTNIVVENLEFRGYTDEGLLVTEGRDIVVRGNRFVANGLASVDPGLDGEGFGVNVSGGERITLENNEAADNGPAPERVAEGDLGTGINTYGMRDSVIRGNYSHHNRGGGILVEDSMNLLVEENRIEANELDAGGYWWDGGIWLDGGRDVTLRGNTITGNHGPGLEISDEDSQYPTGYVIEGNTITGNVFGLFIWNFGQCPYPSPEVARFDGNTVEDNVQQDVWCEP